MKRDQEPRWNAAGPHCADDRRAHDEVYSFVLRVHLHARARGGPARMRFHLEDVGAGKSWRLTDFNSIVDRLKERVSTIEATALG